MPHPEPENLNRVLRELDDIAAEAARIRAAAEAGRTAALRPAGERRQGERRRGMERRALNGRQGEAQ